jgi:hypothetical protein
MNLKFLFFPFSLAVATVLTIWFIWPTWFDTENGVVVLRQKIESQERELENITNRKNNLTGLKVSIDANSGDVSLANKYYPEEKDTEMIINEANYFATSSKVSIVDLDVVSLGESDRRMRGKSALFKCLPLEAASSESVAKVAASTDSEMLVGIKEAQTSLLAVTINVAGGYEDIRNFIVNLQGMEMINNVNNISIKRDVVEEGEGTANSLVANIETCFGYAKKPSIDREGDFINHEVFSQSEFDFSYADKIEEEIYRSAAAINIGESGKNNPFIP